MIYGIICAAGAVLALILIREKPPTAPSAEELVHKKFFDGLQHILKQRDMIILLVLFFIGLGIFNAVSSMVDSISANIGVNDSDGLIGVLMLAGGVIGAVIIPILSDKFRKRKLFLVLGLGGMLPGVIGLSFANVLAGGPDGAYAIALISAFILGFFVMSAGPIGFQYAAEVSFPAPESTSQGLMLLSGQISGLILVAGMSVKDNQYIDIFMKLFVVLAVIALIMVLRLKESPMIITEEEKFNPKVNS